MLRSKSALHSPHGTPRPGSLQLCMCRLLRLNLADEARIAGVFQQLLLEFPDVSSGSYPSEPGSNRPRLFISLESKDQNLVEQALARFQELLNEQHDETLHTKNCLVRIDSDVGEFERTRNSMESGGDVQ
jgi:molybdopterin-biosynthesis enzyme MoeA-like protein